MHESEANHENDPTLAAARVVPGGSARQREQIAKWVLSREDLIRRLARRRLNAGTRAIYDSEDIFSTVLTRMDGLAARGALRLESAEELTALLVTIVNNSTANKGRLIARSRRLVDEDGEYARRLHGRLQRCEDDDEATLIVCRMMSWLSTQESRQILGLRLRGMTHGAIGQALGLSESAVRKRWQVIRSSLFARIERGDLE